MRLTKTTREHVEKHVITMAFSEKMELLEKAIAKRSLEYLIEQGWKLGKDIPEGFVPYIRETSTAYHERNSSLRENGIWSSNLPQTVCDKFSMNPNIPASISDEWKETKEYISLIEEKEESSREIRAILFSCTTSKQLAEVSPELYKFLPEETQAGNLPVAIETVERVNKLLSGIKE